jgi:hypothetical protein
LKDNIEWLKSFSKTPLRNQVPLALKCVGIGINIRYFVHCGLYRVIVNNGREFGFMAQFFLHNFTYVALGNDC